MGFERSENCPIQSFFGLLQQIVQPLVRIKSFFFDSTENYIELAKQNPKFQHILQIGSDIDDNRLTVIDLVKTTQSVNGVGMVVLVPRPVIKDGPAVKTSDGSQKAQPMIFYMDTKISVVQYNWLDEFALCNDYGRRNGYDDIDF